MRRWRNFSSKAASYTCCSRTRSSSRHCPISSDSSGRCCIFIQTVWSTLLSGKNFVASQNVPSSRWRIFGGRYGGNFCPVVFFYHIFKSFSRKKKKSSCYRENPYDGTADTITGYVPYTCMFLIVHPVVNLISGGVVPPHPLP